MLQKLELKLDQGPRAALRRSCRLAAFGAFALVAMGSFVGAASMTAPTLSIESVEAERAGGGALVTVRGRFPFDDVVGSESYAMQLFVRAVDEGTRFVCFSTRWGPMAGQHPEIDKGLDADNWNQMAAFATLSQEARFVRVEPGQIQVQLEPDFPVGRAEAQFFVEYNGVPVFSNPVTFEIEEDTP